MAENLFSDMPHCPVDSLTEGGGLYLSHRRGARWGNVAYGVVCRGYRVGIIMGEAEPSCPTGIVDCHTRRGRRQRLHCAPW